MDQLGGFIIGAGHDAKIFKDQLDQMEENVCQCGCTPSEVGEEFVSSEDEARTELSYASVRKLDLLHLCFSLSFQFFMFLAISFYVSLTNLFSITHSPFLLNT